MSKPLALVLIVVNALALGAMAWFFSPSPTAGPPPGGRAGDVAHTVSPAQLSAAGMQAEKAIAPFTAADADGHPVAWADLLGRKPLVVLFVKNGCPCNVEFETFFQRLVRAYPDDATFLGLIDADAAGARKYADANQTPYRLLADPERTAVGRFGVRLGCSVALVRPDGTLHTLWPGYSADMLGQLSRQLADLAGVAEQTLDVSDVPSALQAGCPFTQ